MFTQDQKQVAEIYRTSEQESKKDILKSEKGKETTCM